VKVAGIVTAGLLERRSTVMPPARTTPLVSTSTLKLSEPLLSWLIASSVMPGSTVIARENDLPPSRTVTVALPLGTVRDAGTVIPEKPLSLTMTGLEVAQVRVAVTVAGAPPGTEPGVTESARSAGAQVAADAAEFAVPMPPASAANAIEAATKQLATRFFAGRPPVSGTVSGYEQLCHIRRHIGLATRYRG
jgi:hypothetical protein